MKTLTHRATDDERDGLFHGAEGASEGESVQRAAAERAGGRARTAELSAVLDAAPRVAALEQTASLLEGAATRLPVQRQPNRTGLPDHVKTGIEQLSGYSMDEVKVEYDSPQPAKLGALATTQGKSIHVAPGQESQVPHEAWHAVQQMQGRVQATMDMGGTPVNDSAALESEADVMGAKAAALGAGATAQLRRAAGPAGATAQLRRAPVQLRKAPLQAAGWWDLAKVAAGAVVGGVSAAAIAGAGTLAAGATLGAAGAAYGRRYGRGGAVLGGVLGAAGGLLATGYAGVSALTAGAVGAVTGGVTAYRSLEHERAPTRHSLGKLMYDRAVDQASAAKKSGDAFIDYLDPAVRDAMKEYIGLNPRASASDVMGWLDARYEKRRAAPGDHAKLKVVPKDLSDILLETPFIRGLLSRERGEAPRKQRDEPEEKAPPRKPLTQVGGERHANLDAAIGRFNHLVARDDVSPIRSAVRDLTLNNAMGHEGDVHLGWVAPQGALLHELGHHLEQNLTPVEIATLHNHLRARSASDRWRSVGYASAVGSNPNHGYDADVTTLDRGSIPSVGGLLASVPPYLVGSGSADRNIDRFVIGHGNHPDSSYATQVYPNGVDTEYLSTTINFFASPETTRDLVEKDPVRVCLFLSFAQPAVYRDVARRFDAKSRVPLDDVIHKLDPENPHRD